MGVVHVAEREGAAGGAARAPGVEVAPGGHGHGQTRAILALQVSFRQVVEGPEGTDVDPAHEQHAGIRPHPVASIAAEDAHRVLQAAAESEEVVRHQLQSDIAVQVQLAGDERAIRKLERGRGREDLPAERHLSLPHPDVEIAQPLPGDVAIEQHVGRVRLHVLAGEGQLQLVDEVLQEPSVQRQARPTDREVVDGRSGAGIVRVAGGEAHLQASPELQLEGVIGGRPAHALAEGGLGADRLQPRRRLGLGLDRRRLLGEGVGPGSVVAGSRSLPPQGWPGGRPRRGAARGSGACRLGLEARRLEEHGGWRGNGLAPRPSPAPPGTRCDKTRQPRAMHSVPARHRMATGLRRTMRSGRRLPGCGRQAGRV